MSAHNIFLIFDSHSRPSHPRGAGFTFNVSIDSTARTLAELLAVDSCLLADTGMQWQMQLLSNFSGHMFLSTPPEAGDGLAELSATVLESSLEILALRAELEELKSRNSSLIKDKKRLENKLNAETSLKKDKKNSRSSYVPPSESLVNQSSHAEDSITRTSETDSGYWSHDAQSPMAPIIYYSGEPVSPSAKDDQNPYTLDLTSGWNDVQRQNANVALQTQIEFEEEDRRLRAEHAELVAHSIQTIFKCSVCLDEHPEDYVARVDTCQHTFCRDCLRNFIISKLDEHRYPIFCPICTAEKTTDPGGEFRSV
jgi:Ring finger domain